MQTVLADECSVYFNISLIQSFFLFFFGRLLLLLCLLERNRSPHPEMLRWITVSHFVTLSSYEAFKSVVSQWECFEDDKSGRFQPRD